jgi:DNA-binding protein YbaB
MQKMEEKFEQLDSRMQKMEVKFEQLEFQYSLMQTALKTIATAPESKNGEIVDLTLYPQGTGRGFNNTQRKWKFLRW